MTDNNDGGNSRSERLRQRRSARSKQDDPDEVDDPSETGEIGEPSEQSKPSQPSKQDEPSKRSVKEEQVGTYMYLPHSQKKEIERLYNMLKAEYEYEYDEEFEKNRHFFPLLVQYGLDSLDGLDASEIRERLDSL